MNMFKKKYAILMTLLASFIGLPNTEAEALGFPQMSCCDENTGNFFVRGDLLYFKSHISGLELDFGTDFITQTLTDGVLVTTDQELDVDPHFKWRAGYRIAAGYDFDSCGLGFGAVWTHFQDSGRRSIVEDAATDNSGSCRLKFDQVDLGIAFNSSFSPSVILKPFLGLRLAKIHQSVHATVVTDITLSSGAFVTQTRTFDDHENYRGIGPVLGLQGDWDVGNGFGFYGTAAASVLYGRHKTHFDDTSTFTAPISSTTLSLTNKRVHEFDWNIDLAVGITWQTCICDSIELTMKLGFEHHQYFDFSHLGSRTGDLCMDGGVFSLGVNL